MKTENPDDIWEGVTPCMAHRDFEEGCEFCEAEYKARSEALDALQQEGMTRSQGLAQSGVTVSQDVLNHIKLDLIVDTIFQDRKNRMLFEGEFGRRVLESMKVAQQQVTTQMLVPEKRLTVVKNGARPKG